MNNFVTPKLMGGLGNYLFQISAAYAIGLRDDKKLICDYSDSIIPHKSYAYYKENVFKNLTFVNGVDGFNDFFENGFNYKKIPKLEGNLKIIGYFQSDKYFIDYRDEINKLFNFDFSAKLKDKYPFLIDTETCSIHVRRGDYLNLQIFHTNLQIEYYKNAIDIIGNEKTYLIFSDDISWCEEHFKFIDKKFFISGNFDYEDITLMSKCNHNIIANSSFSWWGAWLNEHENKKVISPQKWFGINNLHLDTSDLYCDKWIII
jgi:hypothetical protein